MSIRIGQFLVLLLMLLGLGACTPSKAQMEEVRQPVIVQASDLVTAIAAVESVGGVVTHELGIIDAVGAQLTAEQAERLETGPGIRGVYADRNLATTGKPISDEYASFPMLIGADVLHQTGITGRGVTVAVVDTGVHYTKDIVKNTARGMRLLIEYNAIRDRTEWMVEGDSSGHGSHVSSILLSSEGSTQNGGWFNGIAPDVDSVAVRAFDLNGVGSYLDVIRGINWVVANRDLYNIRVLNLSFSAPPQSYYWDDPLNQAVMAAWQAGIVVVAAAGNTGPNPMTIGVPGNVPYIISVGAMTDNYTPTDDSDDVLAPFSAAGPTVEGFVKPEIVAPGGHLLGIMGSTANLAVTHPEYRRSGDTFIMSGTSQAAAVVSGIAALLLSVDLTLSPDDVKCRIMASARAAVDGDGRPAYTIFQQGAGMVNAYDAVYSTASDCANQGLDLSLDLSGLQHFQGRANSD